MTNGMVKTQKEIRIHPELIFMFLREKIFTANIICLKDISSLSDKFLLKSQSILRNKEKLQLIFCLNGFGDEVKTFLKNIIVVCYILQVNAYFVCEFFCI